MKWAYDIAGAEPIIKDMPAYDAATIAYGELLMLGTTAHSAGADAGISLITAYSTTVASAHAVDAVGISLETKTTADSPSIATAANATTEQCYVKTIINPFAIYRAEYDQSDDIAITSASGTNLEVAGVADDSSDGTWVYFSGTPGPNYGSLRYCLAGGAAATFTMDTALPNTATTADKVTIIEPKPRYSNALNAEATGVAAFSSGTALVGAATNLRILETYIDKNAGLEIMHPHKHYNLDNLPSTTKFYSDLMMKDHAYGVQE